MAALFHVETRGSNYSWYTRETSSKISFNGAADDASYLIFVSLSLSFGSAGGESREREQRAPSLISAGQPAPRECQAGC
jgi:hypothetical protein